jgi:hypothetical protein
MDKPSDTDLSLFRPAPDEIHDLVPHIMRHPVPGQSSPKTFFSATCSAINSAKTSSFGLHLLLQELDPFLLFLHLAVGTLLKLKSGGSVLEQFLLPAVEHRCAQAQFFTQFRDWHTVQKMPPQDGYFFFWGEMLPFLPHTFAPLS